MSSKRNVITRMATGCAGLVALTLGASSALAGNSEYCSKARYKSSVVYDWDVNNWFYFAIGALRETQDQLDTWFYFRLGALNKTQDQTTDMLSRLSRDGKWAGYSWKVTSAWPTQLDCTAIITGTVYFYDVRRVEIMHTDYKVVLEWKPGRWVSEHGVVQDLYGWRPTAFKLDDPSNVAHEEQKQRQAEVSRFNRLLPPGVPKIEE